MNGCNVWVPFVFQNYDTGIIGTKFVLGWWYESNSNSIKSESFLKMTNHTNIFFVSRSAVVM